MKEAFVPDAYCGLYCASCPAYQATQNGTLEEMFRDSDKSPEDAACHGCKSRAVNKGWCSICTLKACAKTKGYDFCYECAEYPCKELESFKNDPNYPYHSEVYDSLKIIKAEGKDVWLEKMKTRWSCPDCGNVLNWWDTLCPQCGIRVNGYINPQDK